MSEWFFANCSVPGSLPGEKSSLPLIQSEISSKPNDKNERRWGWREFIEPF